MTTTRYTARTTRTLTVTAEDGSPDLYLTHLRAAVRTADEAHVPDHAQVHHTTAAEFTQVITFTWNDEHDTGAQDDGGELVNDLLTVWPTAAHGPVAKVWADDLATALSRHPRGTYAEWTGRDLLDAARRTGLRPVQIKRGGTNKRGLTFHHIQGRANLIAATTEYTTQHDQKED